MLAKEKLIAAKIKLENVYKFLIYAIYENKYYIISKEEMLKRTKGVSDIAFVTTDDEYFCIYFSKEFLETEKVSTIAGVILHEIMHVVLMHLDRMALEGINRNIYAMAADFYINGKIKKENKLKLPNNALYDKKFDSFSSTDEIYEYLKNNNKKQLLPLEGFDLSNNNKKEYKELTTKIKTQIEAGLSLEKNIGNKRGSSLIKSIFKKAIQPVINWRNIVSQTCSIVKGQDDYSFYIRNPLSTCDFILPGSYSNTLHVCFIVDVSGSIMEKGLSNILMEIIAATSFVNISGKIITCDTSAKVACEFSHDENLENKFKQIAVTGGGGTDMNIGLKLASKLKEDFDLYILVTDGYIQKTNANIVDKKLLVLSTDIDCSNQIVGDFTFAKINHVK